MREKKEDISRKGDKYNNKKINYYGNGWKLNEVA